jgi:hypothetical protein
LRGVKRLPLVLSLFLVPLSATARAAPPAAEHALGLGLGYSRHTVLDEAATSLAHRAHLLTGSLLYRREGRSTRFAVRLGSGFGHQEAASHPGRAIRFVEDDLDGSRDVLAVPMRGSLHTPSAELSLERRVDLGAFSLLAGGAARFEIMYADGFSRPGLMQLFTLRPSIVARHRWREGRTLELGLRATLIGWRTRMPYHQSVSQPNTTAYRGMVHQGSDVRTIDELQTLELEASYEHAFGAHGAARATLGIDWLHDRDPRHLFAATARGALSILHRF